ncbi:phenol hydroxylase [Kerstersia similis]|uniref:phenol hydroxylase n=1 Tax=Kerstersia similis TaxID=206505 RepID=UPI0039F07127
MNIDLQAREIQPLRQTFDRVQAYTGDKPASRYLEAILSTQPTENFHYRATWEPQYELFDQRRTAIRMADWNSLRDPRQFYYATWTMARARQQEAMDSNYQFVESRDLLDMMPDALRANIAATLMPLRHVAWGGNMNNCSICSRSYGTAFSAPVLMHAMDHLGAAQYLTRLGLLMGTDTSLLDAGKADWLEAPAWQPLRRFIEDSFIVMDPVELFVLQNVVLDGLLYPLIYGQYIDGHVAQQGGTPLAMLTVFMPEWHKESARWTDAVLKVMAAESAENKAQLQEWLARHGARAQEVLVPVAKLAMQDDGAAALHAASEELNARMAKIGLSLN